MSWENLNADDYGQVAKLTCREDSTPVDISTYTTRKFILTDPDGAATLKTATFDTDGTDGVLKYTLADGDIDQAGNWQVQARISKTGTEITSDPHRFYVGPRLD
jgi:hypothetical protein